jgi:hypothetical protein
VTRLPGKITIATEKLTQYLLTPRPRNDKSQFLAQAGYVRSKWRVLENDLRSLVRTNEAEPAGKNPFGEFYSVRGVLRGPNGTILQVETIWIQLEAAGETRFVTLKPDRGATDDD